MDGPRTLDAALSPASPTEIPSEDTSPADIPKIEPPVVEDPTVVPHDEPTVVASTLPPPEESRPLEESPTLPADSPMLPADSPPPLPEGSPPAPAAPENDPDVVGTLLECALRDCQRISDLLSGVPRGEPAGEAEPLDAHPGDAEERPTSAADSATAPDPLMTADSTTPPAEAAAPAEVAAPAEDAAPASSSRRGPHTARFAPDPNNPHEMRLRRFLDSKNRREEGRKARRLAAKAAAKPAARA